jgi:hypothetical protein
MGAIIGVTMKVAQKSTLFPDFISTLRNSFIKDTAEISRTSIIGAFAGYFFTSITTTSLLSVLEIVTVGAQTSAFDNTNILREARRNPKLAGFIGASIGVFVATDARRNDRFLKLARLLWSCFFAGRIASFIISATI